MARERRAARATVAGVWLGHPHNGVGGVARTVSRPKVVLVVGDRCFCVRFRAKNTQFWRQFGPKEFIPVVWRASGGGAREAVASVRLGIVLVLVPVLLPVVPVLLLDAF